MFPTFSVIVVVFKISFQVHLVTAGHHRGDIKFKSHKILKDSFCLERFNRQPVAGGAVCSQIKEIQVAFYTEMVTTVQLCGVKSVRVSSETCCSVFGCPFFLIPTMWKEDNRKNVDAWGKVGCDEQLKKIDCVTVKIMENVQKNKVSRGIQCIVMLSV